MALETQTGTANSNQQVDLTRGHRQQRAKQQQRQQQELDLQQTTITTTRRPDDVLANDVSH